MSRKPVSVTAQKVLKNGNLSKKVLNFDSVTEAADYVEKNSAYTATEGDISKASRGVGNSRNKNAACGYVWSR